MTTTQNAKTVNAITVLALPALQQLQQLPKKEAIFLPDEIAEKALTHIIENKNDVIKQLFRMNILSQMYLEEQKFLGNDVASFPNEPGYLLSLLEVIDGFENVEHSTGKTVYNGIDKESFDSIINNLNESAEMIEKFNHRNNKGKKAA